MGTDRCISCGEPVPEGTQVCWRCRKLVESKAQEESNETQRDKTQKLTKMDVIRIGAGGLYCLLIVYCIWHILTH